MEITFCAFRFNCENHLLYKDNELIPLKRNQGALLEFFLTSPDAIHSKDDILDNVWKHRIVSEQVVFQTISQLRQLISPSCIKTFSKKGYKWQLPVAHSSLEQGVTSVPAMSVKPAANKAILGIIGALFCGIILFYLSLRPVAKVEPIGLIAMVDRSATGPQAYVENILTQAAQSSNTFSIYTQPMVSSLRQGFASPQRVWLEAQVDDNQWGLWAELHVSEQGHFLHYSLTRRDINWQGYLYAHAEHDLASKLSKKLRQLYAMGLFDNNTRSLNLETLKTMYELSPEDPDLMLRLAKAYIAIEQQDVALTYLQRLVELDNSYAARPYQAEALWHKGKIYKMRSQHLQASNSLGQMNEVLSDTPLWPLTLHNIETSAWLAFDEGRFGQMFEILDKGLKTATQQGDPLSLFRLHLLYSALAQKAGQGELKFSHLNQAQSILMAHSLDESNQAMVYLHFALFTEDNQKALPYLHKIIDLPRSSLNYWVLDSAQEMLVNHYIEQKEFEQALNLFTAAPFSADELLLQGRIFLAQGIEQKARFWFQQAFEQAKLNYKRTTAIHSAMQLYQLTSNQPHRKAEIMAYLESNADPAWLKQQTSIIASQ